MLRNFCLAGIAGLLIWGALWTQAQDNTCPSDYAGFLAPRLQVGGRGVVAAGGSGNRVRANPTTDADQVGIMPPGTEFEVIAGPQCDFASSIIWWQVATDGNLRGWTAEGLTLDDYFLEPVTAPGTTATPTLTPSPRPTSTATATPTAVDLPALALPDLAVLSPQNLERMEVIAEIATTGRAASLFFSPDMAYLFVARVDDDGSSYANVYKFPGLQPVTQGIPLDNASGHGVFFTPNAGLMVAVDYNDEEAIVYRPGETSFTIDREMDNALLRTTHAADLNSAGVLALGVNIYNYKTQKSEPALCFIDLTGDQYAPGDRLCLPQESQSNTLVFLPDGRRVINGTYDALVLYDAVTGEVLEAFKYGIAIGGTMAAIPGSDAEAQLPTVLISKDGFLLGVNLETGEERTYPSGVGYVVREIVPSPDGGQMMLVVPTANLPDVLVISLATKSILHREALYGGEDARYSPDGRLAFINNALYETVNWQQLDQLRGDQHIIDFSPDGRMLLVHNTSKRVFELFGVPNTP